MMMPARPLAEIDADIAALEAVRRARITGRQVAETSYDGRGAKFVQVSLDEINNELARLRLERARASGCASGLGPVRVGFGSRP